MTYRTDRQRVEALILPAMLLGVLLAGVDDPDNPDAKAANEYLLAASREAVADLPANARGKIVRRSRRVQTEVMVPYEKEGARVDKVGLIAYFLLKAITDSDYMRIGAGTPMEKGVDLMLVALAPSAEIAPLLESARKQAGKVLGHLQRLGYYQGVPLAMAA